MGVKEKQNKDGVKKQTENNLTGTEKVEGADGNVNPRLEKQDSKSEILGEVPKVEPSVKSKSVLKQGHLRVKEDGQKVYKKTPSQIIMSATQLGIGCSVGRLSAKPERDVLMVDFSFVEKVFFPSYGSKETPSHRYNDFRFKSYAPVAFRYFRDIFKIQPSDFLISLANEPIREIGNPGASGSLFFVSNDDMFIVKTVQHKEATFLQQLLPGYYMNLHQNPRTLLPKFFGLYCYQSGTSNIRLTVMNNLLPSKYKCHLKFDLKGSTYKRKASKAESSKKSPTYKDLDYLNLFPDGIQLDADTYDAVIKTIARDLRVLESFSIMDYSLLLGIHNIDESNREKQQNTASPSTEPTEHNPEREARRNEFVAALEAIQVTTDEEDDYRPLGGIPARNAQGERLILFLGIIDILQSYRLAKKMEHGWKSLLTDGDTVSVHNPSFYAKRFLDFIKDKVFKKVTVQRGLSKRRSMKVNLANTITHLKDLSFDATSSKGDDSNDVKSKTRVVKIIEPNEENVNTKSNVKPEESKVMLENTEYTDSTKGDKTEDIGQPLTVNSNNIDSTDNTEEEKERPLTIANRGESETNSVTILINTTNVSQTTNGSVVVRMHASEEQSENGDDLTENKSPKLSVTNNSNYVINLAPESSSVEDSKL